MEYVAGNIFVRQNRLNKGQVIEGHTHNFDHVPYVTAGDVVEEYTGWDAAYV